MHAARSSSALLEGFGLDLGLVTIVRIVSACFLLYGFADLLRYLSGRRVHRADAHSADIQSATRGVLLTDPWSAVSGDAHRASRGAGVEQHAVGNQREGKLMSEMAARLERLKIDSLSRLEQSREVSPPSTSRRVGFAQHAVGARRVARSRTQIAPHYLPHIYASAPSAKAYFVEFFASRGLSGERVANDSCCLASCIDDAVFVDRIDVFRSVAVERVARRLYALDVVLHDFSPEEELTPVKLEHIERYELSIWGDETSFRIPAVDNEVLRRLRRSRRLTRLLADATAISPVNS